MKFHRARLCLDCDEVHEQDRCPVCGSEQYVYPWKWANPEEKKEEAA